MSQKCNTYADLEQLQQYENTTCILTNLMNSIQKDPLRIIILDPNRVTSFCLQKIFKAVKPHVPNTVVSSVVWNCLLISFYISDLLLLGQTLLKSQPTRPLSFFLMHRVIGSVAPVCHTTALDYELWVLWASLTHSSHNKTNRKAEPSAGTCCLLQTVWDYNVSVWDERALPNNPTATWSVA